MREIIKSEGLIEVESSDIISALKKDNGMIQFVDQLKEAQESFKHDITTAAGRKKTASFARKFATVKSNIDAIGKEEVSGIKAAAKMIDSNRKFFRDQADILRDKARQPLSEWEAKEDKRVMDIKDKLYVIKTAGLIENAYPITFGFPDWCLELYEKNLQEINDVSLSEFDEFAEQAYELIEKAKENLNQKISEENKRIEREKAATEERARLEAEREKLENEKAKLRAAQEKMEAEKREKERKEQEEMRIEAAKKEAAERAEREKVEAERRAKEAEERAEQERIASEKRAKEAAEAARLAEIKRQTEIEEKKKREQEEREANEKHVAEVKLAASKAIAEIKGISIDKASIIIETIASGNVPNVYIRY